MQSLSIAYRYRETETETETKDREETKPKPKLKPRKDFETTALEGRKIRADRPKVFREELSTESEVS
jgi:hypothetical protein